MLRKSDQQMSCNCNVSNKHFCRHKAISIWYLEETGILTQSNTGRYVDEIHTNEGTRGESRRDTGVILYPPQEEKALKGMIDYMS